MHHYLLLFFATALTPVWALTVIKSIRSHLVLDASREKVQLQNFTGSRFQLWTLEATDTGKIFIFNTGNGKYLDIQGEAKKGAKLITQPRHGGLKQQWFIHSDNTIVSAAGEFILDIPGGNYSPENEIILFTRHGGDNQKFFFQHYNETYEAGEWAPVANA